MLVQLRIGNQQFYLSKLVTVFVEICDCICQQIYVYFSKYLKVDLNRRGRRREGGVCASRISK